MKLRFPLLSLVVLLVLILGACAAPAAPAAPAAEAPAVAAPAAEAPAAPAMPERSGGTLRIAMNAADISSLDPHFATTTQDRAAVDMIFNALVRYTPGDSSTFEPDLAENLPEPEMMDGKQVWTFNLRHGVMCHATDAVPSYELTSADVVWSLAKSANTETSAYAGEYAGMTRGSRG